MKIIVVLFWSLVIGQVVGYIATALGGFTDSVAWTACVSLLFGLFVLLIDKLAITKVNKNES